MLIYWQPEKLLRQCSGGVYSVGQISGADTDATVFPQREIFIRAV